MLYAGCSGYSFREWVGRFYPPKTKAKDYLPYYASQLNSVEINYSFRRFPKPELTESWARATPESFKFSVKMHQRVTHRLRLKNVGEPILDFMEALSPLGPRLGVVLFQCPPTLKLDMERLEGFLEKLPKGPRFAMEFRHESWDVDPVSERLHKAGVALCAADVEIGEARRVITAPFAYMRLRKPPPYDEAEIASLQALLRQAQQEVDAIYLYVKHDEEGHAPESVKKIRSAMSV